MSKKEIISLGLIGISFIITTVLFFTNDQRYSKISFKFYDELSNEVVTEERNIMLKGSNFNRAEKIVDELFLGPMSVFNRKLVPYEMGYNHFYLSGHTAYLDLPLEFITDFDDNKNSVKEVISLIEENIVKNIKGISRLIITIDGETMGSGPSKKLLPQEE